MYMAGGEYPDGSASQAFMRYDPVLDLWQEMANLRTPRSELGKYFNLISIKTINFYNPENHFTIIKDEKDIYYQGCIFYPYKNQKIEVLFNRLKNNRSIV